jgi:2,3-bisphosphoglycerate-independent phosphoglycerate mutase
MGNSEVGHMNLGAGFIVYQDLTLIDKAIEEGTIFSNSALRAAMEHVQSRGTSLHLLGLLGNGGVHSHSRHLFALLEMAHRYRLPRVFVHVFTDGRDTPPDSGLGFVRELEDFIVRLGTGRIATVSGRYYAMDRDKRWERIKLAYDAIVHGKGRTARSAREAIERSYSEGVTDEFIVPCVIVDEEGQPVATASHGDAFIHFNFRADRARQLTRAIVLRDFSEFDRGEPLRDILYVTMTEYEVGLPVLVAFRSMEVKNPLAKIVSDHGLTQFHVAETEKYAHVTYFLNCGYETPFPGEDRLLVPSPKVATYDLKPEMSAHGVTEAAVDRIRSGRYDFVVINYANCDMVGHTGVIEAARLAAEAVDRGLGSVVEATLAVGGALVVTADHGNAEQMIDPVTGGPHTAHSMNPAPCVLVAPEGSPYRRARLRPPLGRLCDVTLTLLQLMDLPPAPEMTCRSLIEAVDTA